MASYTRLIVGLDAVYTTLDKYARYTSIMTSLFNPYSSMNALQIT